MSDRDHRAPEKDATAPPEASDEHSAGVLDEVDVRELLRGALREPDAPQKPILREVQRRIRKRSRGKFYGDGWSTARSPRSTYLMTSIIMLALIAFIFLVLIPWSGGSLP